jgi:iron complex transport system substrate-binding protein
MWPDTAPMAAAPMSAFGPAFNMHTGASGLLVAALLLHGCSAAPSRPAPADRAPLRIVSMNPCVDTILMEVARPEQIAAISHYSQDSRATSVPLQWAMQYPIVSGAAEDVIAAQPDLVIAGPHVALPTLAALGRLGIPVLKIAVPQTVKESKAQITEIAARIGRDDAGAKLNARIDAAITNGYSNKPPIRALIWQGSGLVPGKDTLADELLKKTGFRNISTELGLQQWDILPLEEMIYAPPTVLLTGAANMGESEAEDNRMLSHPIMRRAQTQMQIRHYPSSLLNCGGPTIIKSVDRLAQVRRSVGKYR